MPVPAVHRKMAVDAQESEPGSVLHFARSMIALRKARPALACGAVTFHDASDGALLFERRTDGERIYVRSIWPSRPARLTLPTDSPSRWRPSRRV
ncbi:MAG: hypothetical protein U1E87_04910 [Alphaproteobacteria bacterium]